MIFYGVGLICGSIIVAIVTEYYNPFLIFKIGAFVTFLIMIAGFYLNDELETN